MGCIFGALPPKAARRLADSTRINTFNADYSADGLPIRLFLTMLLNFGWRFEEVMARLRIGREIFW